MSENFCATVEKAEVFDALATMRDKALRYDVVIVDPPAFAKSRKDVPNALRAYRKLARLAATLVSPGGILFIASCSYNITVDAFGEERKVARGLGEARAAPAASCARPARPRTTRPIRCCPKAPI